MCHRLFQCDFFEKLAEKNDCWHLKGCDQIGLAENFGEFWTWKYRLRIYTGVDFKIWWEQQYNFTSFENFIDWLSDKSPNWASYCAFMSGCLILLDKHPGVCPFRVGENWRRLFTKIVIRVTVPEATRACQDDQLCSGLKAVIDDVVHGVQAIWDIKSTTEFWEFLRIDGKNAFNEINWIIIMWTVQHLWPSIACFVFNWHRLLSLLVLRNKNGMTSFLHSREGVTQGEPQSLIAYVIGILPFIKNLKMTFPHITQPWYSYDARALGTFRKSWGIFSFVRTTWPGTKILYQTFKNCSDSASKQSRRQKNCFACVMGLMCAKVRVILAVISGTTTPNMNGWQSVQIRGSRKFSRSEKLREIY